MAPRASASVTITFGLVSVPVKLFLTVSEKTVSFEQQHAKCGGKLRQQFVCAEHDTVVTREATAKAFALPQGTTVSFTEDELARLKSPRTDELEIQDFLPRGAVDPIFYSKTYFVGVGDDGDYGYRLLVASLNGTDTVALGRLFTRGRDQLVLVQPVGDRLLLRVLYYSDEVRSSDEVPLPLTGAILEVDVELARRIIEQRRSPTFEPAKYRDTYPDRVRAAAEAKAAGREVPEPEGTPARKVVSMVDALRETLAVGTQDMNEVRVEASPRKGLASVRSLATATRKELAPDESLPESQRSGSTGS
jgi:DNA end-binding protein Ku